MSGPTIEVSQFIEDRKLGLTDVGLIVLSFWLVVAWDLGGSMLPATLNRLATDRFDAVQLLLSSAFGYALGGIAFGYLGDRTGRRAAIVVACLMAGIFNWLVVKATDPSHVRILQFLAGCGMGGLLANVLALYIESAPRRFRIGAITLMLAGSAVVRLILTPAVLSAISVNDWRIVFHVAGVALILTALVTTLVPESLRFLAIKGGEQVEIARRLTRVQPQAAIGPETRFVIGGGEATEASSLDRLFSHGLGATTPLLWLVLGAALIGYVMISAWVTGSLARLGLPSGEAIIVGEFGGAAGALVLCAVIDRFGMAAIASLLAGAVLFVGSIGFVDPRSAPALFKVLLFLAGFCSSGANLALYAIAGNFYPTSVRATGIGFVLGVGQVGLVFGLLFVVGLGSPEAPTQLLFLVATMPFIVAAVAAFALMRLHAARTHVAARLPA